MYCEESRCFVDRLEWKYASKQKQKPTCCSYRSCVSVYVNLGFDNSIPAELLCEEVLHSSTPDELGKGTGKPKGIRQPGCVAALAEFRLEITLAKKELSDQGFTRRHVRVILNPGATNRLEPAVQNFLFDLLVQGWGTTMHDVRRDQRNKEMARLFKPFELLRL